MCLVDRRRFRFTIFPKKIYKVVKVENGKFYSPFENTLIKPIMVGDDTIEPIFKVDSFIFEGGFIHAFTRREEAETLLKYFLLHTHGKYDIIEGYIPSFTRYAKDDTDISYICTRKIIFKI